MTLQVFLVEDDPLIQVALADALHSRADIRVVGIADKAIDAVLWMTQHPCAWDVVIVDLFLAEGSGLTVLSLCRVRGAAQKAVVFSNYATALMRRRCEAFGADAVFDKSTDLDALLAFLSAHRMHVTASIGTMG